MYKQIKITHLQVVTMTTSLPLWRWCKEFRVSLPMPWTYLPWLWSCWWQWWDLWWRWFWSFFAAELNSPFALKSKNMFAYDRKNLYDDHHKMIWWSLLNDMMIIIKWYDDHHNDDMTISPFALEGKEVFAYDRKFLRDDHHKMIRWSS